MTPIDPRASAELALRARLAGGEAVTLSETNWDVSGRCERPVRVTVEGRQYRSHTYDPIWGWVRPAGVGVDGLQKWSSTETVRGHAVHLDTRCGRCAPCLRERRRLWTIRAHVECVRPETKRTWFVTLTASPSVQMEWTGAAFTRLDQGGTDPTRLSEDEWYAERCKEAGRALTKYVKRLRKEAGEGLRNLWVFEKHEGGGPHAGLPHIHGLVHEVGPAAVNYRLLRAKWGHGYVTAKLLTDTSESESLSRYVSKCLGYLTKSTSVRIRASQGYGDPHGLKKTRTRCIGEAVMASRDSPRPAELPSAVGGERGAVGSETPEGETAVADANAYAMAKAGEHGVSFNER